MLNDYLDALHARSSDDASEKMYDTEININIVNSINDKALLLREKFSKLETSQTVELDFFDETYKDSHFIKGFSELISNEKLIHLGQIAELISDVGRSLETYAFHSMSYLMTLTIERIAKVSDDFRKRLESDFIISDLVGECEIYLRSPIEELLRLENHKRETLALERNTIKSSVSIQSIKAENAGSKSEAEEVDSPQNEEDEVLNIPIDKVGLISDFCEEAWENLQLGENLLIELENNPNSTELVNKLFRAVHTIKGGSRLIEIRKIESLSHELENVLDAVRAGRSQLNESLIDVALECIKRTRLITDEVAHRGPITTKVNDLILALKAGGMSVTQKPNTTTQQKNENVSVKNATIADEKIEKQNSKVKISRDESIKVSSEKLDAVLDTAAEVYINRIRLDNENRLLKQSINELTANLEKFKQHVPEVVENKINNRVGIGQNWNLNSKNEGIAANQSHDTVFSGPDNGMTMALERINLQVDALQQNIEDLEVLSSRLQSGAMNFRMVPIIQLFSRFPAQVRDIARQIDKNVELKLTGGETELDKIIVNQLGDPLLHIMRNSIDHGIENREDRISQKKPEVGQINLRAYYSGSNAVIEIEDDGKGINKNVILKKALEKGMIGEEQVDNLQDKEIFDLIFEPGFSSADQVTELSGRGVGMDVVKTAITQMQGSVKIESKLGIGTKIILKLPLTLAVIGILLASENDHEFAFPILNVEEVMRIDLKNDLDFYKNTTAYNFRGELINVKFLSDFLEFPKSPNLRAQHYLVVLNDGEDKIGIIVDDVKGQQNVLLKQTGSLIAKIPYVMGCTILSSSKLVLILNVLELSQVPNDSKSIKLSTQEKTYNDLESLRLLKKLLIVDDSQMQRKRISDHLLGSGYRVLEAPDGYQALKLSESTFFDALLVDLQMPVMDGYEFIASIRKASSYRNVPIIVISGGQTNRDGITTALEKFDIVDFFEKPVDLNRLISVLDNSILPLKSVVEGG